MFFSCFFYSVLHVSFTLSYLSVLHAAFNLSYLFLLPCIACFFRPVLLTRMSVTRFIRKLRNTFRQSATNWPIALDLFPPIIGPFKKMESFPMPSFSAKNNIFWRSSLQFYIFIATIHYFIKKNNLINFPLVHKNMHIILLGYPFRGRGFPEVVLCLPKYVDESARGRKISGGILSTTVFPTLVDASARGRKISRGRLLSTTVLAYLSRWVCQGKKDFLRSSSFDWPPARGAANRWLGFRISRYTGRSYPHLENINLWNVKALLTVA